MNESKEEKELNFNQDKYWLSHILNVDNSISKLFNVKSRGSEQIASTCKA